MTNLKYCSFVLHETKPKHVSHCGLNGLLAFSVKILGLGRTDSKYSQPFLHLQPQTSMYCIAPLGKTVRYCEAEEKKATWVSKCFINKNWRLKPISLETQIDMTLA